MNCHACRIILLKMAAAVVATIIRAITTKTRFENPENYSVFNVKGYLISTIFTTKIITLLILLRI